LIVIDTHVLIWAVQDDNRLGSNARNILAAATASNGVHVSAMTPWEIAMLAQKGRLALGREVGAWIIAAMALPGIILAPIEPVIAIDSVRLPGRLHGDPADRLIIATARHAGLPLLTADGAILEYGALGHVIVVDASV
jgi:PIN domain nuclease of toxin-antitoxin system